MSLANDIHSCGYHCTKPACVLAQRNELVRKLMTLHPHQQRVLDEKTELDTKANALSQFIGCNPMFPTLDAAEQERLRIQNDVMWQYSEILGARIAAF